MACQPEEIHRQENVHEPEAEKRKRPQGRYRLPEVLQVSCDKD